MEIKAAATRLLVSDIEACCRFYRDLLGLPVVVEELNRGYVEFKVAGHRLSLFRQQEMAEIIHTTSRLSTADCQDRAILIFTVTDIDRVYSVLHHQGVEFAEPPTRNADFDLKIAYCRDPEGNLIGLFEQLM